MLCLQFCLLALIAWKMVDPRIGSVTLGDADAELAELKEVVAARAEADAALQKLKLRSEVLDQVTSEVKGTAPGFVERLQEKYDQTQRFAADVETRDSRIRELERTLAAETSILRNAKAKSEGERGRLKNQVDDLTSKLASVQKENESLAARIAKYEPPKPADPATGGDEKATAAADPSIWWYVGGGILAAVVVAAGVWWGGMLLSEKHENGDDQPITKDNEDKASHRHEPNADSTPPTPDT
jgi:hypothetical protein